MKLRRSDNECRPFEREFFTNSETFEDLLVTIPIALALAMGFLIAGLWGCQ